MPCPVIDRRGGKEGCVGISGAKGELVSDQRGAKIVGARPDASVNQTVALPPCSRAASGRRFDPKADAKIIGDIAIDLDIIVDAVEAQTAIALAIGRPCCAEDRSVVAISRGINSDGSVGFI